MSEGFRGGGAESGGDLVVRLRRTNGGLGA